MAGGGTYENWPYELRKNSDGDFWYYKGLTPVEETTRSRLLASGIGTTYEGDASDPPVMIDYASASAADKRSLDREYQAQVDGKGSFGSAVAGAVAIVWEAGATVPAQITAPSEEERQRIAQEAADALAEQQLARDREAQLQVCLEAAGTDEDAIRACTDGVAGAEAVSDTAGYAARWRMAEQCYLLYNMTDLAIIHAASMQPPSDASIMTNLPSVRYNKTHLLSGHGGEIMSKLTMIPGTTGIMHATPAELSSLQPLIRLFKINYSVNGTIDNEIEFDFLTHHPSFSYATSSYANRSDYEEFRQDGRRSVGIKSFDWQYIATNPDTIRNDIDAKLVLYFQSFDELIVQRQAYDHEGKLVKYRYLDLLIHAPKNPSAADGTVDDTAGDEEGCGGYRDAQEYDSSFYEVQVQVGWAPPNSGIIGGDLLKSIKHNRTSMFLSLMDHEFNIREDGTYELIINYKARLDGILASPKADVLLVNGTSGDDVHGVLHQEWMALEEKIDKVRNENRCSDSIKKEISGIKEEIIKKKDELRADTYRLMLMRLQHPVTNQMFEGSDLMRTNTESGDEEERSVIYHLPVSLEDIQLFVDRGVMGTPSTTNVPPGAPVEAPDAGTEELEGIENDSNTPSALDFQITGWDMPKATITRAEINDNLENVTIKDNYDPIYNRVNTEGEAIRMLSFFYLGELIDCTATAILNNTPDKYVPTAGAGLDGAGNPGDSYDPDQRERLQGYLRRAKLAAFNPAEVENIRILLGPLEYINPYDNKNMSINLADVPISLNLFIDFFHRKVIKPQKETYNFVHFIRDLVKELVIDALGDKCFYGSGKQRSQVRIGYVQGATNSGDDVKPCDPVLMKVQLVGTKGNSLTEESSRALSAFGSNLSACGELAYTARLNMNEISLLNTNPNLQSVFDYSEDKRLQNTYQYVVLYTQGPGGLVYPVSDSDGFAEDKDEARGIHHLHIGRDRGILKNISFSKTDAPALREARMEQEKAYNPLVQLSNVYEAEVTMFGNTLFYPGSYVYLNPFGLGNKLGIPSQKGTFSNIMGLGGYNLITEVSSYIEPGKYETKLKLRFDTSGDGCRSFSGNEDSISNCEDEPVIPVA